MKNLVKGRPRKYNDEYHRVARQKQKEYYKRYREACLLGCRLGIKIPEARKILKENPDLRALFTKNITELKLEKIKKKLEQLKSE